MIHNVFISYASKDGLELANRVMGLLKEKLLLQVYLADRVPEPGREVNEKIAAALHESRQLLVLLTPKALESKWVLGEVDLALDQGKPVVVCRDLRVKKNEIPIPVRSLERVDFSDADTLMEELEKRMSWGIPVIIPAAGSAHGVSPLSLGMPKILLQIGEKPILHHIIRTLEQNAELFSRVVVLTRKRYAGMAKYYASLIDTLIPVECIATPADSLPQALVHLAPKTRFMIHYSDIILEGNVNWEGFVRFHNFQRSHSRVIGTLMASSTYKVPVGHIYPDEAQHLVKKPTNSESNGYRVNMAVSIFEPEFLQHVKKNDRSLYGQTLPCAMRNEETFAFYSHEQWRHIQTIGDWVDTQNDYLPHGPGAGK
ncbi:TIR domain-containing protein [Planctomycetota bacterium]